MTEQVTPRRFHDAVDDWRVLGQSVCTYFRTGSLAVGARLVLAISELPGVAELQPCLDLRSDGLTVRRYTFLPTPDGLTTRDIELALGISAAARALGVTADPSVVQNLVVSVDALVVADVLPFWRAVLDYRPRADAPDEELTDPHLRGPVFFFNRMDAPRQQRNRLHLDVFVPHDQAAARVAAALAAGGHLVTDEHAPAWWVLADAEGNEVCVATP
jgi:4a-hydroxytetrahydrobiopterin dehydratase